MSGELGLTTTDSPPSVPLSAAMQTYLLWRWPFELLEWCRRHRGAEFALHAVDEPPYVVMSGAAEIRAVLSAPSDVLYPGEGAGPVAPIAGERSFMLLDGDAHLAGRRAVLPALHGAVARQHAEVVHDVVTTAVACWPRDARLALHPRLRALGLEVVLRTAFGESTMARFPALYDRLLAMLSATTSSVYRVPRLRHGPGKRIWQRFLRERAQADTLIYACIDEHRGTKYDAANMLDVLLAARGRDDTPMSRAQLRDNIMSLIVAGHETTASQLAWAFQLLAHNPAAQRRLIDEIDKDIDDQYMTATIYEILRHRPVFVFAIPRAVKKPIEIGGWTYEPPTQLLACVYLQHHDPQVYPEPHLFRPERFLEAQPESSIWLPWGGGRRHCPGQHLAIAEMTAVLRAVLSCMTIEPGNRRMERPRWRSMIVTPHAGSLVVLRPRARHSKRHGSRRDAHIGNPIAQAQRVE